MLYFYVGAKLLPELKLFLCLGRNVMGREKYLPFFSFSFALLVESGEKK